MQLSAFSHRPFVLYWLARFCATFAVQIIAVAVAWQVYDLTRDPLDLGIIGMVQFLPMLLLVLVTGSVADRYGHRLVMLVSLIVQVLCAAGIFLFAWRGLTTPMPIFVALTVLAVARAFFGPASQALVVYLVPKHDFANAVGWNSSAWQVASIVGPVAGGLLYGVAATVAYGTSAVILAVATVLMVMIPSTPPPAESNFGRCP